MVDGEELIRTALTFLTRGLLTGEAVAADNIQFAMLRIGYRGSTEGSIHADELFETTAAGAQRWS